MSLTASIERGKAFSFQRPQVIAEIAQAHDGSLGMAHSFIDSVADAGADGVKFQTHIAAAESTAQEQWRIKFSPQDASRFDYWKRMEFTEDQWLSLKTHAEQRRLHFLSSPFSVEAAQLLKNIGMTVWKVASGELDNRPMLNFIRDTKQTVILSTGMSTLGEVNQAIAFFAPARALAVLQCTSLYPCPSDKVGLNVMSYYREHYGVPVGLSDHSGTIFPGLAAVTLGASIVEVHATFSRDMFGPDASSSITMPELNTLVQGVRFIANMLANPMNKDSVAGDLEPTRTIFGKKIVAVADLPIGHTLSDLDLTLRKSGAGIPASMLDSVIGKRLNSPIKKGQAITQEAVGGGD
jgi:N,N'-diacetyllegionaminate synthase